jgi:hypothetical protein
VKKFPKVGICPSTKRIESIFISPNFNHAQWRNDGISPLTFPFIRGIIHLCGAWQWCALIFEILRSAVADATARQGGRKREGRMAILPGHAQSRSITPSKIKKDWSLREFDASWPRKRPFAAKEHSAASRNQSKDGG